MVPASLSDEEIFQAARRIDSADARRVYLDQSCGDDATLRKQIEALLAAYDVSASFLESPAAGFLSGIPAQVQTLTEGPGTEIGPYKLRQQIGEGGMGVVFMAEQTEPIQRTVALKIIKPGMDTRQVIARFEAERQALAMMDHPNIAKVLDAGTTQTGRPYFVMELVNGKPITQFCDEKHLSLRQRLELLKPVCEAIQHAHQKGVIHRDIKPTNVLVAEYDARAVPKVIDFGVAKATAQKLAERTMYTELGQIIGTVEYMSPEQAKFSQIDVDTRSDIYSLGVLAYELLTGSTPFGRKRLNEAAFDEKLRIIREEEPPKPSTRLSSSDALPSIAASRGLEPLKLNRLVRGDLDWIVMKALEKDRNRRYESASEMAADLQHYLNDEPVQACPPSAMYRFRKLARRYKAALATAGLIAAMLVGAVAILSVSNARVRRESAAKQTALQQKEAALQEKEVALRDREVALVSARENESLAQSRFYAAQMNLAQQAWEDDDPARTVDLLESLRPRESGPDLRGFEWYYLYRLSRPNLLRSWQAHNHIVTGIAWSPDGSMFATCSWEDRVRLWDGRTGEHLRDLAPNNRGGVRDVAFSPDGKLLALAGNNPNGDLIVWDVTTWRERWRQSAHPAEYGIEALAISPDSHLIATSARGESNPVKLWSADDGKLLTTLVGHKGPPVGLAFSPDGKTLASADGIWVKNGSIILWDLKLPAITQRQEVKETGAEGLVFSEDGQTLFAGKWQGVRMIDVPTATVGRLLRKKPARVHAVRQVPGKKQIVAASEDRAVRLWDLETMQSSMLGTELAAASSLAISPRADRIACGDNSGWVSLRILAEPHVPLSYSGSQNVQSIAFTPKGRSLIVAGSPLCVLDGSTLELDVTVPDEAVAVSPANMLAAIYNSANHSCMIWNINSREAGRSMDVGSISHAHFSPDGKLLATWHVFEKPILQLWNTDTGERIERFDFVKSVALKSAAFSPDGRYLAAGLQHRSIAIYDLKTKSTTSCYASVGLDTVNAMEYSPDGYTLAAGLENGGAILFDVDQQSGALKLRSHLDGITQRVDAIAFSPDGRTLVTAVADGSLRFYDSTTAQERATFKLAAKSLAFSPDGKTLAIMDDKSIVRLLVAGADARIEKKAASEASREEDSAPTRHPAIDRAPFNPKTPS